MRTALRKHISFTRRKDRDTLDDSAQKETNSFANRKEETVVSSLTAPRVKKDSRTKRHSSKRKTPRFKPVNTASCKQAPPTPDTLSSPQTCSPHQDETLTASSGTRRASAIHVPTTCIPLEPAVKSQRQAPSPPCLPPYMPSYLSPTRASLERVRQVSSLETSKALGHHKTKIKTHNARAAAALDDAGNVQFQKGNYNQAMESYQRALKIKKKTMVQELDAQPQPSNVDASTAHLLASVATSINNIGYLRQRSGATPDETMKAYQDSLKLKRKALGDDHLSVGKTLNNIGSVYFSKRQLAPALSSYAQALTIMQRHLGMDHLDVATVHSNIGDVYAAQRNARLSRECYQRALHIRWSHLGEHHPKVDRLLEKIAAIEMKQDHEDDSSSDDPEESTEQQEEALHDLHVEVQKDITYVEKAERKLALDMVKDKLRMLRDMRDIDSVNDETDELHPQESSPAADAAKSPSKHLSPVERKMALSSLKERLAKMKELKAKTSSTRAALIREGVERG